MDNYIDESTIDNQEALEELTWAIEASEGRFYIMLARCNYAYLQDRLIQQVQDQCALNIRVIHLKQSDRTLYSTICAQLGQEKPAALMVSGLATVDNLDDMLRATNQVREEFRKNFHFPVILWINDAVHVKFLRIAPDFESWTTTTRFAIPTDELIEVLQQNVESLFATALAVNSSQSLYKLTDVLAQGCLSRSELDLALKELPYRVQDLDPQLEAGLQFIRGLNGGDSPEALEYFQQSLTFWQQVGAGFTDNLSHQTDNLTKPAPIYPNVGKTDNLTKPAPINAKLKAGLVLFHIGLYHYRTTDRKKHQDVNWQTSKINLQHCLDLFDQENRPDLVAKCITQLERVLQRMQAWDELEQVAKKALPLHQQYGSTSKLAQDYSFLAEVALQQQRWDDARQAAQQAEDIISQLPKHKQWIQGLNLLFLAQAERQLGNKQAAIYHLVKARELGDFGHPLIYVRILEELRYLYFEDRQYLAAFATKQLRRSIEQQYGIRAFIGAGRLQPHRQEASAKTDNQESVAPEIIASGRQRDLERLLERIGRNDCKLIVIHGRSGVGKSSLVNAGLVPALKQSIIGTQKNVPISIRVYTNWIEELEKQLLKEDEPVGAGLDDNLSGKPITAQQNLPNSSDLEDNCPEKPTTSPPNPPYAKILEQLRKDEQRQRRTVLIFDQFEEFFFVYTNPAERRLFWQFLADCLNILSVKVILSLREDYLHYLLECNRLDSMSVIGHDILGKNVLYELGNFLPTDARAIIEDLTTRSRFYLDPALIDQLVKDLAGTTGEILPIELQVVGAQLQAETIKTLAEYRELGTKEELVKRYLEEVVEDCGVENQQAAELVLYLLTDEKGTRPLKTRAELERDLGGLGADLIGEAGKLDLVLRIFVDSGLVFLLPETPYDRYQLVHDYLAEFIRKQQESRLNELIAALEKERERRQKAEALSRFSQEELTQARQKARRLVQIGSGILAITLVLSAGVWALAAMRVADADQREVDAQQRVEKADTREKEAFAQISDAKQIVKEANDTEKEAQKKVKAAQKKEREALKAVDVANLKVKAAIEREKKVNQEVEARTQQANQKVKSAQVKLEAANRSVRQADQAVEQAEAKLTEIEQQTREQIQQAKREIAEAEETAELARQDREKARQLAQEAQINYQQAQAAYEEALQGTRLEQESANTLQQFLSSSSEAEKVQALISAIEIGDKLESLVGNDRPLKTYPATSPLLALQIIIDSFQQSELTNRNRQISIESIVRSISFSPDGEMLAIARQDGVIELWHQSVQQLSPLTEQKAHQGAVTNISFSQDRHNLVTAGQDGVVKLWKLSGTQLFSVGRWQAHQQPVTSISVSQDGQRLVTTGQDGTVQLWESSQGELNQVRRWLTGQRIIVSADISPNGRFLATLGGDGTVTLWDWSGQLQQELKVEQGQIMSVHFSPDSQHLVTGELNGTVRIWNLSGEELDKFNSYQGQLRYVGFSPDKEQIITVGFEGTVRLWNLSGRQIAQFGSKDKPVVTTSFSPDTNQLIAVDTNNLLSLHQVRDLHELLQQGCNILNDYRAISLGLSKVSRCK